MQTLILPEIILLDAYKKALKYIRNNYNDNLADVTKSFLGIILGNSNAIQRYNLLDQSKKVFITTENDPRNLDVNLFFNASRASVPTIHITNPSDTLITNALSISEGYQDPIFDDVEQTFQTVFNRKFRAKYNIVLTSDNTNEILLMYNVIRSITISMMEHLELSGLQNIKISGADINLKSDIIPINVFIKAIGLEFEYDVVALKLDVTDFTLGDFIPVGFILPTT